MGSSSLTAASQHYAATGDEQFKERVDYIVNELDSCQINFVNGFIGGMPGGDKVFKEVKKASYVPKGSTSTAFGYPGTTSTRP